MNKLISNSKLFLKRNSSTILTYVGAAGVIGTTITAIQATPKAMLILEQMEEEKGDELTNLEKIQVAVPVYIPTIILGASTLACIFGANVLNKRNQASITSAYALLSSSYKEYRDKVLDLYGEEAESLVVEKIAQDNYDKETAPEDDGGELFYDDYSNRYFRSTVEKVQRAEYEINRDLIMMDYATINDFYKYLDLPPIEGGDKLGWTTCINYDCYWQLWIDFSHSRTVMDDGTDCRIIRILTDPIVDFEDYYEW